jgi:phage/plasmid-like protein (TIGR03299 family)
MPAGITERDGFFSVRRPAWWDLAGAHVLDHHPERDEAQKIAHNWEPETEPLYRLIETPVHLPVECSGLDSVGACFDEEHHHTEVMAHEVPDFDLVKRSDDGFVLTVKPRSRALVTNNEMYDIAEALMKGQGTGKVIFETAGSVYGGKKVWILMRFSEPLIVAGRKGTATIPYFALQNFNDGKGAFRGQATEVCIVCDNTSKMADLDAQQKGTEFVFRHTANVHDRIEEAKAALAGWQDSVVAWQRLATNLIEDYPITLAQERTFIDEFIPLPQTSLISDRVRGNVVEGRLKLVSIFEGPTQAEVRGTAWGLVQGALEYSQWYRKAKTAESRFKRAYLDKSSLTTDALELALSIAKG